MTLKLWGINLLKVLVRVKRWMREDRCARGSSTWKMREWPQSKALDEGEDEVKKEGRESQVFSLAAAVLRLGLVFLLN